MVTTTIDLTVLHTQDGVLIVYETGSKNAYEGVFDMHANIEYDPSKDGFIPHSVRGVASAYVYMNDVSFRVYLVPEYRPDASLERYLGDLVS